MRDAKEQAFIMKSKTSCSDSTPAVCDTCGQIVNRDVEELVGITPPRAEEKENIVTWDGPHDPDHPKNLTATRKWMIVYTTCLMAFCVTFSSSVFSSCIFATAEEFDTTSEVMLLGVSLFGECSWHNDDMRNPLMVCFALSLRLRVGYGHLYPFTRDCTNTCSLGPLLWGPLSEAYGRTRPLYTGMAAFCILQIPVAVAKNLQTIFICRFLQAVFGAAPVAILAGMYVDILEPIELGIAVSIFAAIVFASPAAGPIVGSFVTQSSLGWRWTAWITFIISVVFTSLAWVTTPETFAPLVLRRKAQRLRYQTRTWGLHAESEEQRIDFRALTTKYLTKPLRMIVLEPIVSYRLL